MMLARIGNDIHTAEPGLEGATCPLCAGPAIAKCGEVNVWHWAHRTADCDPWSEPMTQWHLDWQQLAPQERREVTIGNHRADLVTPRGIVVEIQHSHLSVEQIEEREDHYRDMVWIFDAREPTAAGRLTLATPEHCANAPMHAAERQYRIFRWTHARRSIGACQKPVYLDLGDGVLLVGRLHFDDGPAAGWGHLWTREQVAHMLNEPFQESA